MFLLLKGSFWCFSNSAPFLKLSWIEVYIYYTISKKISSQYTRLSNFLPVTFQIYINLGTGSGFVSSESGSGSESMDLQHWLCHQHRLVPTHAGAQIAGHQVHCHCGAEDPVSLLNIQRIRIPNSGSWCILEIFSRFWSLP